MYVQVCCHVGSNVQCGGSLRSVCGVDWWVIAQIPPSHCPPHFGPECIYPRVLLHRQIWSGRIHDFFDHLVGPVQRLCHREHFRERTQRLPGKNAPSPPTICILFFILFFEIKTHTDSSELVHVTIKLCSAMSSYSEVSYFTNESSIGWLDIMEYKWLTLLATTFYILVKWL